MNLNESRINNIYNIEKCENFLNLKKNSLKKYIVEIEKDKIFLDEITQQINFVKNIYKFKKGIFRKNRIKDIHEFSFFRILLYVLVRFYKPDNILETGVFYGGNTLFLLKAIYKNRQGTLISIDLPHSTMQKEFKKIVKKSRHLLVKNTEMYRDDLMPGFIIPEIYKKNLHMKLGEATSEIKKLRKRFDFYIHDSDHSYNYLKGELSAANKKLTKKSFILVDDIDWSNAFYSFVNRNKYYPMLFTDNGKDNLRVRVGMVYKNHLNNNKKPFTT